MLRSASIRSNEWQIDLRLHRGGKFDLGPFRRITKTLQRHLVSSAAQIETFALLELVDQPVDDALVQVVTTQVRIAVRSLNFDQAFSNSQDRNIKCPATKIVDRDRLILFLVQTIS